VVDDPLHGVVGCHFVNRILPPTLMSMPQTR